MTFISYIIYILSMAPLLHVQIVQKGGRLCLAEVVAAPIMQTLNQGQSDQGVSENCSGKPDMSEWTLVWQQKNPLSTALHPPVWKQSSTCRFHSRAHFFWLEARLAPSGIYCGSERATGTKLTGSRAAAEETVKREFLRNQQMAKNVTW